MGVGAVTVLSILISYPHPPGFEARLFWSVAVLAETPLLLAPAMLVTGLAHLLPGGRRVAPAVAVVASGAVLGVLLINARIVSLYGFGINGFVWNLVTTPGGLRALGVTAETWRTVLLGGVLVTTISFAVWQLRGHISRLRLPSRLLLFGCCALLAVEKTAYAVSMYSGTASITEAARYVPFYLPVTSTTLLSRLLPPTERRAIVSRASSTFAYPREALQIEPLSKRPNILWLVAESFRADALRPKIMPHTTRFAAHAWRFTRHFSGGNGTRMGMFSMFYGIPGSYWFAAQRNRIPPVLTRVLRRQGYQLSAYTSTNFSYPEFDATIFAGFHEDELVDDSKGPSWQRDRQNVDRMVADIEGWGDEPHFLFMFFESTHAPYVVAPDAVVIPNYLRHFDYMRTDIEKNIDGIRNRYLNTAYHLDSQIARLIDALQRSGHLDDTIVLITGDHGEAFLEDGLWGHNSDFDEAQLHVPLVLRIPGEPPHTYRHITCHEDIVATLLPRLGVRNAPMTYTTGIPLTEGHPRRTVVAADWSRLGLLAADYRVVIPYRAAGVGRSSIEYRVERAVATPEMTRDMAKVLAAASRFYRP